MAIRLARSLLPFVLLIGALPGSVAAQDEDLSDLDRILSEAREARVQVRYQGEQTVYAFLRDKTVVSRFQVRYAYPYFKRESIGEKPERSFVLLDDGSYRWRYLPCRKIVLKEPSRAGTDGFFPTDLPANTALIRQNYNFTIRGPVPAESGDCHVIEFLPKWQDRPRREIWLQGKWKIPVRVYVAFPDGRTSYMSELRKLSWNPDLSPEIFQLRVPEDTRVYEIREEGNLSLEQARTLLGRSLFLPRSVPRGFSPFNILLRMEGGSRRIQIVYADGLASFSMFQEWVDPGAERSAQQDAVSRPESVSGASASGAEPEVEARVRQYGLMNVLTLGLPGRRTVFVGDVPEEKLLEAAQSLAREPDAGR